jgi:hypothetical protein
MGRRRSRREIRTVADLIERLGGPTALAHELGLRQSAVSNWCEREVVPAAWHARILAIAVRQGVAWRPPGWPPQACVAWEARDAEAMA